MTKFIQNMAVPKFRKWLDANEPSILKYLAVTHDELDAMIIKDIKNALIGYTVQITIDNIAVHYEFMDEDTLEEYAPIISPILNDRYGKVFENLKDFLKLSDFVYFQHARSFKPGLIVRQHLFGVKDEMKPIDEFMAEIISSKEYEYLFENVVITKDNIADYYEFMGIATRKRYAELVDEIFQDRVLTISQELDISSEIIFNNSEVNVIEKNDETLYLSMKVFSVKDVMKTIEEYIAEIKDSEAYYEYISTETYTVYAIETGGSTENVESGLTKQEAEKLKAKLTEELKNGTWVNTTSSLEFVTEFDYDRL